MISKNIKLCYEVISGITLHIYYEIANAVIPVVHSNL